MSSQASFPERLTALMVQRRIGVPRLSEETGIPQRTIARYRSGTSAPVDPYGGPTPNAHALAQALEVSIDELLDARPEALAS